MKRKQKAKSKANSLHRRARTGSLEPRDRSIPAVAEMSADVMMLIDSK